MKRGKLKAPFPAFGGKARVAAEIWERTGNVDNWIEPFFNSGAVTLLRPHAPKIETVNDLDCYIANFWRATQHDPEAVAEYADGPVNEVDLHSRHRWLVLSDDAAAFRKRMRTEPDYFNAKVAGWWCWGLCCWIGSRWCVEPKDGEPVPCEDWRGRFGFSYGAGGSQGLHANGLPGGSGERSVKLSGGEGQLGHGVHAKGDLPQKKPRTEGDNPGSYGKGVHAQGSAGLAQKVPLIGDPPRGVHRAVDDEGEEPTGLCVKRPFVTGFEGQTGRGIHAAPPDGNARGRGVHGHDEAGTCARRRAWLLAWFGRLRDRLRTVRVCCGDWLRVCDSESVTTRLGTTGIFFDPPYGTGAGRDAKIYACDSLAVAAAVRAYCLERGDTPQMRICLAGYSGEGHEVLEDAGWDVVTWKSQGGYGNRSARGKANARKERLWFSPHCLRPEQPTLFGD